MVNNVQRSLIALICITSLSACSPSSIQPFTSDGCSLFPDGDLEDNERWLNCCTQHDIAYWQGGSKEQRYQADLALKQCVSNLNKEKTAELMFAGVRAGGSPYFPTWYRWGYGWPYTRGYAPLTEDEQQQIEHHLKALSPS